MSVKKVQQSVPAGALPVVERRVQPPSARVPPTPRRPDSEPPPLPDEDPSEDPSEDSVPMSTGPYHFRWLIDSHRRLEHRYRLRTDPYFGCDLLIYY